MALQDTDRLLVNRGGQSYRVDFSEINADAQQALTDSAAALAASPGARGYPNG